jgi:rare lipoprotein A
LPNPLARAGARPPGRLPRGVAAAAALAAVAVACVPLPHPAEPGVEIGVASWYGPGFHGRPTSSREIFDMKDLTAAHRTLPFGTYVMVTNLASDRSVVVRINDRGPFKRGRIIDLSYAAACVLGLIGPGTARVRVEVLKGFHPPSGPGPSAVWIQVGAFSVQENAYALKRRLDEAYRGVIVTRLQTGRGAYFRVRVRADEATVQDLARRLADQGFPVVIVREPS